MSSFPSGKDLTQRKQLLQFNEKKNANPFKDFYRNLAADLVNRLPAAKNMFVINSVREYYSALNRTSDSLKPQLRKRYLKY